MLARCTRNDVDFGQKNDFRTDFTDAFVQSILDGTFLYMDIS